jgi:hypothetical protein
LKVERYSATGRHLHLLRLVGAALHVRKNRVRPRRDVLKLESTVLVRLGRTPELHEVDDAVVKRRSAVGQLNRAAHRAAAALRLTEQPAVKSCLRQTPRREQLTYKCQPQNRHAPRSPHRLNS